MKINISSTKPVSFKGYDARPLKAVVMTINDSPDACALVKEISDIGKKDGFDVFFANGTSRLTKTIATIKKNFDRHFGLSLDKWAQDRAVLTPENKIIAEGYQRPVFAQKLATLSKGEITTMDNCIEGGNLFYIKNDGKNEMLLGADELIGRTPDFIKKTYGVEKIHILPQADYHIDLFYRPLADKKILIPDDNMTVDAIKKGLAGIKKYISKDSCTNAEREQLLLLQEKLKTLIKEFKNEIKMNRNHKADDVEPLLRKKGFEPIRVPGRIYSTIQNVKRDDLAQRLNYINALVHQKADKSITYITGKSALNEEFGITPDLAKKIGFDFEEMFVKSVEPHIKREDIHFVSGAKNYAAELLEAEEGSIHCLCNEIPLDVVG